MLAGDSSAIEALMEQGPNRLVSKLVAGTREISQTALMKACTRWMGITTSTLLIVFV